MLKPALCQLYLQLQAEESTRRAVKCMCLLAGAFSYSWQKKSVLRPCWNAQDANAQLGRPEFLPVLGEFCFHCDLCTEANLLCFCMV